MKNYFIEWTKEKTLLNQEQVSVMSSDEIAIFIRNNPHSFIVRKECGTIEKIVERRFTSIPIKR